MVYSSDDIRPGFILTVLPSEFMCSHIELASVEIVEELQDGCFRFVDMKHRFGIGDIPRHPGVKDRIRILEPTQSNVT